MEHYQLCQLVFPKNTEILCRFLSYLQREMKEPGVSASLYFSLRQPKELPKKC